MSFCVVGGDQKICLVETSVISFDFNDVPQEKVLRNRVFLHDSVLISVLFYSDSKDRCEQYVRYHRENNEGAELFTDLDQLVLISSDTSTLEDVLVKRVHDLELQNKESKQQLKQLNLRLRKVEELVNVAQIEIGFKIDGGDYAFMVPAMDESCQSEEIRVSKAEMDQQVDGRINIAFRAAAKKVFGTEALTQYAPKDKYEKKKILHKVYYVKLFAIKLNNIFIRTHSVSGLYDRRLVSQSNLLNTVADLTQVLESLKGEERRAKKLRIETQQPNTTDPLNPDDADVTDPVLEFEFEDDL